MYPLHSFYKISQISSFTFRKILENISLCKHVISQNLNSAYIRAEWYIVVLFAFYGNRHFAADQVHFYESNLKKSANLVRGAYKVFTFKNHRNLKKLFFIENLQIPSIYFKKPWQKENLQIFFHNVAHFNDFSVAVYIFWGPETS